MNPVPPPEGAIPGLTHEYDSLMDEWVPMSESLRMLRATFDKAKERLSQYRDQFEDGSEWLPQLVDKFIQYQGRPNTVGSEALNDMMDEVERLRALGPSRANALADKLTQVEATLREVRADRDELRDEVERLKGKRR